MFKLCGKDILAARWILLLILGIIILYPLQPFWTGTLLMAMGGTFGFSCLIIVLFLENRNRTEVLYLSLPLKRSTIVGARYLLAGLLTLVGGAAVFGLILPLGAAIHSRLAEAGLRSLFSIEGAAGYVIISVCLMALYLPFYHRSGLGRGMIQFSIAGAVILAAALGAFKLVGRDFDFAGPPAASQSLQDPGAWILGRIESIRTSMGTPFFLLALILFAAAVTLISFRLSLRFYERREF